MRCWLRSLPVRLCRLSSLILSRCSARRSSQGNVGQVLFAGVWTLIGNALDNDLAAIVDRGKLQRLPSHLSRDAMCLSRKSDGPPVTVLDWRLNRLANAVAKSAAGAPPSANFAVQFLAAHAGSQRQWQFYHCHAARLYDDYRAAPRSEFRKGACAG